MKTKLLLPYSHKIIEPWIVFIFSSNHHINQLELDVYDFECIHLLHFIDSGRANIAIFINKKVKMLIRKLGSLYSTGISSRPKIQPEN